MDDVATSGLVWLLVWAMAFGVIIAAIADRKGYSVLPWFFFGFALFIIALPVVLIVRPDEEGMRKRAARSGQVPCPMCRELVRSDAVKCRHCGSDLHVSPCANCDAPLQPGAKFCERCGEAARH